MKTTVSRQGSSLVSVLLVATVLSLALGSALSYLVGEQRLAASNRLNNEARLAAETAMEYGFAQLQRTFSRNASILPDSLNPYLDDSTPLVLDEGYQAIYQDRVSETRIKLPAKPYVPASQTTYKTFVVGGPVSAPALHFIDPTVPGNETNPSAGTTVRLQTVDVYATATTHHPQLGDRQSFLKQSFHLMDQSIFDYAVFYSAADLEIAPGADMEWSGTGPVHSNRNIYAGAGTKLDFNVRVSTAGDFYAKRHENSGETGQTGTISIKNPLTNKLVDLKIGGSYLDSDKPDFRQLASDYLRGGLTTTEHGVQPRYPVGIGELRDLAGGQGNWEHHLIAPPTPKLAIDQNALLDSDQKKILKEIEELKFSTRAGLTVKVTDSGSGPSVELYTYEKNGNEFKRDEATEALIPVKLDLPASAQFWTVEKYAASGNDNSANVTAGLYDGRQGYGKGSSDEGKISLIKIDVGKLRAALEDNPEDWKQATESLHPDKWWNGGVYVQLPNRSNPPARPVADHVVPSDPNWAVQLTNGTTLPNPSYTVERQIYGMTVATNSALYVHGDYNVPDGKGTATTPGSNSNFAKTGHEVPAALVADAITVLSNSWDNNQSRKGVGSLKASDTTVSAAFVTGNVPTPDKGVNSQKNYSGGVENFPRFLEDWDKKTLTYRGSMVMLFQSEVQDAPWVKPSSVYKAPTRNWGYHTKFGEGYRPPLDLGPRVYLRSQYRELTKAEFEKELEDLNLMPQAPLPQ